MLRGQDSPVAEATLPVGAAKLAAGQVGPRRVPDLADLAARLVPVLGGRTLLATRAWELVHVLGHGDAHRSVVAAQSPGLRYAATLALALGSPDSLPALRGPDAVTDRALDWWHRAGPQVVDGPM